MIVAISGRVEFRFGSTTDYLNIGNQLGSHGTVVVTGAGTNVNVTSGQYQNIQVGSDGTAALTVSDHAIVTTTNMTVAVNHDVGVTDTLTVDDASLHVGATLVIGNNGAATVLVENGGSLTAGTLMLAELSGGAGSLTVDGAGSVVTASSISIGGPSAVLTLSNGGAIDIGSSATTIANTIHIGSDGSLVGTGEITSAIVNDGTITATAGTLQIDQQLTGTGSVNVNVGATLHLLNGAASSETIQFNVPSGSTASLVVDHATSLQAFISGFTGNGSLSGSDQIDLKDINYGSLQESYDAANNVLNISDGTNSAAIHFNGTYQEANFHFISDGQNGTIVFDPPVPGNTKPGSTNTAPVAERRWLQVRRPQHRGECGDRRHARQHRRVAEPGSQHACRCAGTAFRADPRCRPCRAQALARTSLRRALTHDPEKCAAVFPRDKRGTRLRGDHAQTTT